MLDHSLSPSILQTLPTFLLPLGVLLASVLGSVHCIAMCGVLMMGVTEQKKDQMTLYHLGRLVSYLALGVLAGLLGKELLQDFQKPLVVYFSITLGLLFFFVGFGVPEKIKVFFSKYSHRMYFSAMKWGKKKEGKWKSFLVGVFSGLLPCGFLYSFVVFSIALQSGFKSALVLFFFWMGTVPALQFSSFFIRKVKIPKMIFATLLILLGSLVLWQRGYGLFVKSEKALTEEVCN